MASAMHEDLTCSICLTLFTDPVTLHCGHAFCRQCIAEVLHTQHHCPLCLSSVSAEAMNLQTSLILKNLAQKAKEGKIKKEHVDEETEKAELCPEHEEKLKLFCITDQQLACIICRDGEKHEGHKFKPIKEAATSLRKELETFVQHVSDYIQAMEKQADDQSREIKKSRAKSQELMTQISNQFEEMHLFLRKREEEIKNELKLKGRDDVKRMSEMLTAIEAALSECRELQDKATTVLKMTDPERFLKSWTEGNTTKTPVDSLMLRSKEFQVVETSLSLEPYESHMQFFMWKEMLQVIQPQAEQISLTSRSQDAILSGNGRSLFCNPQIGQPQHFGFRKSSSTFGMAAPSTFGTAASSTFGTADSSTFGTAASSTFGTAAPSTFGTAAPSTFGTAASSTFGTAAPSTFGTAAPSTFGTAASSTFGTAAPSTFGMAAPSAAFSYSEPTIDAFSVNELISGQHYWEIDVGSKNFWKLGITHYFLTYKDQTYFANDTVVITDLALEKKLQKIGIYLNCSSKNLSFYDADSMTLIHTMRCDNISVPVSAYVSIKYIESDRTPVTMCWY